MEQLVSPSREEDRRARLDMLECIGVCLRNGLTDHARSIGESSRTLKNRIDTHDYSIEDKWNRITQPTVENKG